jgi:hypothetical protein
MNKLTLRLTVCLGLPLLSMGGSASARPTASAPAPDDADRDETAAPPPTALAGAAAQPEQPANEQPTSGHPESRALLGLGFALTAGGGIDDYVGSTMRDTTGIGGGWTIRATFGTHSFIAGELSYIGSAQSVQRLGLAGRSTLYGNGAQAVVRVNATVAFSVQPFAYGGVAWRHYSLSTDENFSDVAGSTDAFEVPVGGGLATYAHGIVFDLRGEYRFCWANHAIVPDGNGGTPNLDRWAVISSAGYSF